MDWNIDGPGWEIVRPTPSCTPEETVDVGDLLPNAPWFWTSLQWYCVPDCCGLDAYEFSARAVEWALGRGREPTDAIMTWRSENPGDANDLADQLEVAASTVRAIETRCVSAAIFNHYMTSESCADLLTGLATKARAAAASES